VEKPYDLYTTKCINANNACGICKTPLTLNHWLNVFYIIVHNLCKKNSNDKILFRGEILLDCATFLT
jgi:hypothetical protein